MATGAPADDWERYARELGVRVHRLRVDRGLSQERLAVAAGMSAFTLRKLEAGAGNPGTAANPRLRTIVALADVLGVQISDMVPNWTPEIAHGR